LKEPQLKGCPQISSSPRETGGKSNFGRRNIKGNKKFTRKGLRVGSAKAKRGGSSPGREIKWELSPERQRKTKGTGRMEKGEGAREIPTLKKRLN